MGLRTIFVPGTVIESAPMNANFNALIPIGGTGALGNTVISVNTSIAPDTVFNYGDLTVDAGFTLNLTGSGPATMILKVKGDLILNGRLDVSGRGFAGGAGGVDTSGVTGNGFTVDTNDPFGTPGGGGASFVGGSNVGRGSGGASILNDGGNGSGGSGGGKKYQSGWRPDIWWNPSVLNAYGTGAGGGGANTGGGVDTGGDGGDGAGVIFIMVSGDVTFGASSEIDISGGNGTAATGTNAGGGGGGGAGVCIIIYGGTLTDNGLTQTKLGGTGGAGIGIGGTGATGATGEIYILSTGAQ